MLPVFWKWFPEISYRTASIEELAISRLNPTEPSLALLSALPALEKDCDPVSELPHPTAPARAMLAVNRRRSRLPAFARLRRGTTGTVSERYWSMELLEFADALVRRKP